LVGGALGGVRPCFLDYISFFHYFCQKNEMSIIEFKEKFVDWLIIPKVEIEKEFPNYSANSLTRWQKKGKS